MRTVCLPGLILSLVCLTGLTYGQESKTPDILHTGSGQMTWTNINPALYYTVEWRNSLTTGEWSSVYSWFLDIQSQDGVISREIPAFFQIRAHDTPEYLRFLTATSSVLQAGYYAATNLALVDPNLMAENIRAGVTLFGVTGTYSETIGPLGQAFQTHLLFVRDAVAAIDDPETGEPVSIPDFDLLFESAGRLDTSQTPARDLATIRALLDRASDVDCNEPTADYQFEFPRDHHIKSEMGFEWYYVGFHLDATDPDGTEGRIAVLFSMQKERAIGLTTQEDLKWNDLDCMLFVNLATATVDFPENKSITRRSDNFQLIAAGGIASYSVPGESFHFECGPDKLSGTENVLPLDISIQDGTNLSFSFTVIPPDGFEPENAFFLQGVPDNTGSGTGITYLPTPGIYYSWPQLKIDTNKPAAIVVDGVTYTINSGSGWMDHQVMMKSLNNYEGAVSPVPFVECPKPYNGWSWQFFNLDNGDAFTGAAFHHGEINSNTNFPYGYYIAADPVLGKWTSIFVTGDMQMDDFQSFPVIVDDPTSSSVMLPTSWKYENIESYLGNPLSGVATPWIKDGTFNGQASQMIGENPVDYKDTSGNHPDGTGFCESIGFEIIENFRQRGIDFLTR